MVNLLIVGPPSVFRQHFYSGVLREAAINVVAIVDNERSIKDILSMHKPNLILVHGAEKRLHLVETINDYHAKGKLMFVLSSINKGAVFYGLKIGVVSFILDNVTPQCLVRSIKNVYEDQYVVTGELVRTLLAEVPTDDFFEKQLFNHKLKKHFSLSPRENEIAFLVYKNNKNIDIAERLTLKEKTVRDYVSKMYRKFGVRKRQDLKRILEEAMQPNN
jgi:DNA-binding NarL/FixJ family response regulator